ncbi:MAG: peptide chain release factor N(5)-glutamine methyltransferase [Pseudomonadota bacterium]
MSETLGAGLRRAAETLGAAGVDDAKLEARRLLEHASGLDRAQLIAEDQAPLGPEAAAALDAAVARRATHEPLAHILGAAPFHEIMIRTDARALVPRSDSEGVVELALELLPPGPVEIADLGTGTGCLLLALLAARPDARGIGLDASSDAADLARENAAALGLSDRCTLLAKSWSDWTDDGRIDLVISNPPYIPSADIAGLAPDVRDYDPRAALDGGGDGLDAYREITALCADQLRPGAWLVLEIGWDQAAAVGALLTAQGFADLRLRQDLEGRDRALAARRPPAR